MYIIIYNYVYNYLLLIFYVCFHLILIKFSLQISKKTFLIIIFLLLNAIFILLNQAFP